MKIGLRDVIEYWIMSGSQIPPIMRHLLQFHRAAELQLDMALVHQGGQGDGAPDV